MPPPSLSPEPGRQVFFRGGPGGGRDALVDISLEDGNERVIFAEIPRALTWFSDTLYGVTIATASPFLARVALFEYGSGRELTQFAAQRAFPDFHDDVRFFWFEAVPTSSTTYGWRPMLVYRDGVVERGAELGLGGTPIGGDDDGLFYLGPPETDPRLHRLDWSTLESRPLTLSFAADLRDAVAIDYDRSSRTLHLVRRQADGSCALSRVDLATGSLHDRLVLFPDNVTCRYLTVVKHRRMLFGGLPSPETPARLFAIDLASEGPAVDLGDDVEPGAIDQVGAQVLLGEPYVRVDLERMERFDLEPRAVLGGRAVDLCAETCNTGLLADGTVLFYSTQEVDGTWQDLILELPPAGPARLRSFPPHFDERTSILFGLPIAVGSSVEVDLYRADQYEQHQLFVARRGAPAGDFVQGTFFATNGAGWIGFSADERWFHYLETDPISGYVQLFRSTTERGQP